MLKTVLLIKKSEIRHSEAVVSEMSRTVEALGKEGFAAAVLEAGSAREAESAAASAGVPADRAETLFVCESGSVLRGLIERGAFAIGYAHADNPEERFPGAPYIVQRAGYACYSDEGKAQIKEQVATYMKNAHYIKNGLKEAGYTVYGGKNSPYVWLKTPDDMTSWEFFDMLLEKAGVVGTPGSGFGPSGEHYFRLTAFGSYENSVKAIERIKNMK
jgi:hypothetical protein